MGLNFRTILERILELGEPNLQNNFITQTCLCNKLQFFTAVKNDNFQTKNCNIFHIFAQNIDCGYTLEPPH